MVMATLDTSLGWVAGDVERILLALDINVSNFTINEITVCCNEIGGMSTTLVGRVRTLLSEYDSAVTVQQGLGVADDAGRVLVKADVLEWEVQKGGSYGAVVQEKGRISDDLLKIFAFCPCVGDNLSRYSTPLLRS